MELIYGPMFAPLFEKKGPLPNKLSQFQLLLWQKYTCGSFWGVVCKIKQWIYAFIYLQSYIFTERDLIIHCTNNQELRAAFNNGITIIIASAIGETIPLSFSIVSYQNSKIRTLSPV